MPRRCDCFALSRTREHGENEQNKSQRGVSAFEFIADRRPAEQALEARTSVSQDSPVLKDLSTPHRHRLMGVHSMSNKADRADCTTSNWLSATDYKRLRMGTREQGLHTSYPQTAVSPQPRLVFCFSLVRCCFLRNSTIWCSSAFVSIRVHSRLVFLLDSPVGGQLLPGSGPPFFDVRCPRLLIEVMQVFAQGGQLLAIGGVVNPVGSLSWIGFQVV